MSSLNILKSVKNQKGIGFLNSSSNQYNIIPSKKSSTPLLLPKFHIKIIELESQSFSQVNLNGLIFNKIYPHISTSTPINFKF